jgi:hypothetical protein
MSLPNFICIGAQKAGTTWLYEMLAQNPSIWMPPLKEVHFFDLVDVSEAEKRRRQRFLQRISKRAAKKGGSKIKNKAAFLESLKGNGVATEEWYRGIFDHPERRGRVSGEITPSYLALDEDKIAYARSLLPDAKILLIVREPRSRNLSQLKMAAARSLSADISETEWNGFLGRLESRARGDYSRGIPLWQKYFPPEQFLILPFSLVRTDPAGMISAIEGFIGAEHFDGYEALEETIHKTKEIPLPDWVVERAVALAETQKEYLINAFGQEFYEKTK